MRAAFGIRYDSYTQNDGCIRFTVAHKVGYHFLPAHREKLFLKVDGLHEGKSGFVSQGPLEWQTHYFASALLMRLHQFREALD